MPFNYNYFYFQVSFALSAKHWCSE